jgi:hypothetical protein
MAYLYRHIRLDKNTPFYIGIGSDSNYKRANSIRDRNIFWKRIINKTEYKVEIMLDDLSWEEVCEKEKEFIEIYGRRNLGKGELCNLTDGGDGAKGVIYDEARKKRISEKYSGKKNPFYGKNHSEETINKLRYLAQNRSPEVNKKIADKNRNKITPSHIRLKMSNSTKGEKNHFFGKKHTEETRKIISEKAIGRKMSNETREKISNSLKKLPGKKLTEETKKKISEKAIGRKVSNETKQKLSLSSPKRIQLFRYVNETLYVFNSLREAASSLKISRATMSLKFKELGFISKQEAAEKGYI